MTFVTFIDFCVDPSADLTRCADFGLTSVRPMNTPARPRLALPPKLVNFRLAGTTATSGTRSVTHLSMARTAMIIQDEYPLWSIDYADFRKNNSVAIAVNADCRPR